MAEKQSSHRQKLEEKVIASDIFRATAGLWLGAGIAVVTLLCCTYLGLNGQPWAAGAIGTPVFGSLVGIFVIGTISRRHERSEKNAAPESNRPEHAGLQDE